MEDTPHNEDTVIFAKKKENERKKWHFVSYYEIDVSDNHTIPFYITIPYHFTIDITTTASPVVVQMHHKNENKLLDKCKSNTDI